MNELARDVVRREIEGLRWYTESEPRLRRRYDLRFAWVRGVACFSKGDRSVLGDFATTAQGFGVLSEASDTVLDAVVRHYDGLGVPPRLLLPESLLGARVVRLVERHGFRRMEREAFVTTLLRTSRAPRLPAVPGLAIERAAARDVEDHVTLTRDGFGDRGAVRDYFFGTQVALMRKHPRSAIGMRAIVDGVPAGAGMLYRVRGIASLGGAAVLRRFRGRGIHHALLAARIALGVSRGDRVFICGYDGHNVVSGHNQHAAGLRDFYRATFWERAL